MCAVNWNGPASSDDLQICVLSFDTDGDLIAMRYNQSKKSWDDAIKVAPNSMKVTYPATGTDPKVVAAVQGPDSDGTDRVHIFYRPVGMIGHFTSKTTAFDEGPALGITTVVLNEEGKSKRRMAKYSEAPLSG
jgi:hypothetical protein